MKHICLYFQIHHPFHYRIFHFLDVGKSKSYYDDYRIEKEIQEMATYSYLPTNKFLLKLLEQMKGNLKLTFHLSGTAIDQFLMYSPETLSSFTQLAQTGQVEFTGGTTSHSIGSLNDNQQELNDQIIRSKQQTEYFFGQKPKLFVNSDLIYTKQISKFVSDARYEALLTNGAVKLLGWRSPNRLYSDEHQNTVRIFFRNESLSNELSTKFEFYSTSSESKKNSKDIEFNKYVAARRSFCKYFSELQASGRIKPGRKT